jgi:hypothetical protein
VLSKSTKIIFNYTFGLLLFVWLCFSIYNQLTRQENLHLSLQEVKRGFQDNWAGITLVGLLMIVNWSLEARKWQILTVPVQKLGFKRALYAIFSGVSLSVITPNRIGEYGGRILFLRHDKRLQGISVTAVGSLSQFITTLVFGLAGLLFYLLKFSDTGNFVIPDLWKIISVGIVVILAGLALVLYFHLSLIIRLFKRIKWLRQLRVYIRVIGMFSGGTLWKIWLFSIARLIVFSAQYLILLNALGAGIIWWQGFLMIFLIYLVMALIPTIAIAELGIRGEAGLFFLGLLSTNKIAILAATAGIWLINLLIPAILGSLLLPGIKVLNEGEKVVTPPKKMKA